MSDQKKIAIIGAGTMGHGIGQRFAQAGNRIVLYDRSEEILDQAVANIERNLNELSEFDLLSKDDSQSILVRIQLTTLIEEAAEEADIVVEAVFENLELKQNIFHELDELCPYRTIFASNTASLMPSQLGEKTNRRDRVLVAHYFYPPHLVPLVELVKSEYTSDSTLKSYYRVAKKAGSIPVVIHKETIGFVANRLQYALFREIFHLIESGIASAQDIDLVVKNSFGPRLAVAGPLEIMEVQAGWKLIQDEASYVLPDLNNSIEFPKLLTQKIAKGELGAISGKGFYTWSKETVEAWRRKMGMALIKRFMGN